MVLYDIFFFFWLRTNEEESESTADLKRKRRFQCALNIFALFEIFPFLTIIFVITNINCPINIELAQDKLS